MTQTTLQQRIEERAKAKLEKDLIAMSDTISGCILINKPNSFPDNDNFPKLYRKNEKGEFFETTIREALNCYYHSGYEYNNYKQEPRIQGWMAKALYDYYLPQYIQNVTDEILQKIDEIDSLIQNKDLQEQDF